MKYLGSKFRYTKEILPIILSDRENNQFYVEPFVGGFNVIDKVCGNRIANDINYYLIELFRAIRSGWVPPDSISEEEYNDIKLYKEDKYPTYLIGFVGFGCSYGGKYFGGYARGNDNKGNARNYCLENKKNILRQAPFLKNIIITNVNYWEMKIPPNSIVYCDPPYDGTTQYKDKMDHKEFWNWVRTLHSEGHNVYVSEYNAPSDFRCVWSKNVITAMAKVDGTKDRVEKLFTLV